MTTEETLTRIAELEAKFTELKALYGEYDELVTSLRRSGFLAQTHEGKVFTLVDNFIRKGEEVNTAYRVSFVKRYDIKISEPL